MTTDANADPNLGNWGLYDDEAAQADVDALSSGGTPFWKAAEGKNMIRVCPPLPGHRSPIHIRAMHRLEDPTDSKNWAMVMCRKKAAGEPCAICEREEQYKRSEDPLDVKAAQEMWAKTSGLANIIDCTNATTLAKGPQLWDLKKGALDELKLMRDQFGDYSHPITGYLIVVVRQGTGQHTKYKYIADSRNPTPLSVQCPGITAESLIDVKPLITPPSYLMTQQAVAKVYDGAEAPAATRTRVVSRTQGASAVPGTARVMGAGAPSIATVDLSLGTGDLDI